MLVIRCSASSSDSHFLRAPGLTEFPSGAFAKCAPALALWAASLNRSKALSAHIFGFGSLPTRHGGSGFCPNSRRSAVPAWSLLFRACIGCAHSQLRNLHCFLSTIRLPFWANGTPLLSQAARCHAAARIWRFGWTSAQKTWLGRRSPASQRWSGVLSCSFVSFALWFLSVPFPILCATRQFSPRSSPPTL